MLASPPPARYTSLCRKAVLLLIALPLWAPAPQASELSPSLQAKVQRIARDIQSTQERLDSEGAAVLEDDLKARQLANRIKNYGKSLAKMPSDDDPYLFEALAAHSALVQSFNAIVEAAASASSAAPSPDGPISTSKPAVQAQQANEATRQTSGKQLVSGQRVRVKKLASNLTSLVSDLKITGPSTFQDQATVARYRTALEKYGTELKRYTEYRDDADVLAAARAYQLTQQKLSDEFQRAQGQLAQLGDVQSILADLRASLQQSVVPRQLFAPITTDEAQQLVAARSDTKRRAREVIAELDRIQPLAYLETNNPGTIEQGTAFDQNDVRSMRITAQSNSEKADAAYRATVDQLNRELKDQQDGQIAFYDRVFAEPEKNRSKFLAEGADQEIYGTLDRMMRVPNSLAEIQKASGEQVSLAVRARQEKLNSLRAIYAQSRELLLGEYTLPTPASQDKGRLEVAAEILANPSYEFGIHGPIVLTTESIDTRSKEVSRDTIKDVDVSLSGTVTWSGTRETWQYDWDEFSFATPLKSDDGDWHVWWITAKYFRSGASSTPLNRWISGGATQGNLILEKNFR